MRTISPRFYRIQMRTIHPRLWRIQMRTFHPNYLETDRSLVRIWNPVIKIFTAKAKYILYKLQLLVVKSTGKLLLHIAYVLFGQFWEAFWGLLHNLFIYLFIGQSCRIVVFATILLHQVHVKVTSMQRCCVDVSLVYMKA